MPRIPCAFLQAATSHLGPRTAHPEARKQSRTRDSDVSKPLSLDSYLWAPIQTSPSTSGIISCPKRKQLSTCCTPGPITWPSRPTTASIAGRMTFYRTLWLHAAPCSSPTTPAALSGIITGASVSTSVPHSPTTALINNSLLHRRHQRHAHLRQRHVLPGPSRPPGCIAI
jgi:hypothetical protein